MVRDLDPYLIHKKFALAEHLLAKQEKGELQEQVAELSTMLATAKGLFEKLTTATERPQFEGIYQELRGQLAKVSRKVDNECQQITLAAQNEGKENLFSNLSLSTLVVLFGLLTVLLSHRALMPLPLLIDSIRKIADGDWTKVSRSVRP